MNRLTIIGNLVRDPELRTTQDGTSVCSFTVAVNKRGKQNGKQQDAADYFRVSAWRQLGENCAKYLTKGKKACVVGSVTVRTYQDNKGETRAQMEMTADDVEFLSARDTDKETGYTKVDNPEDVFDELPM